jgi:hypothetical protein
MAGRESREARRERRRRTGARREGGGPPGGDLHLASRLDRIPGWVAPVLYAVVTLLLFRAFVFSDLMLFGSDTLALGYMARAFFADALQTTGFPLWNPVILGGTPFLESLVGGDALHPVSVGLLLVMETYRAIGWKLVIHVLLAGVFMFAWLRMIGVSRGAALVGGMAFLLAPHMVTLVFPGHDGKIFVVAMTPILFWTGEWFLRRGGLLPLAALAGIVALVILSPHFQMAYFLFGAMGAWMLFRCIEIGRSAGGREGWALAANCFGAFLLFSVVGAGVTAVQLVPAVDYITEHSRRAATTLEAEGPAAVAYSSSWSLHPEEVMSLVVPEFVGNSVATEEWTDGTYWGRNTFKLNHEYMGLVVILLAVLAFVGKGTSDRSALETPREAGTTSGRPSHGTAPPPPGRPRPPVPERPGLRWFMLGMGVLALLFALGRNTPVWRIFYEVVPGISLFRAPSMAIFLTGFAAVTLAAVGIDRAVRLSERGEGRLVVRTLAVGAGLLALGWVLAASGVLTSLWTAVVYSGIEEEKLAALRNAEPHIVRGFAMAAVLAGALALVWWAVARRFLPAVLLVPGLILLVVADQWRVDAAFIEVIDYHAFAAPDPNIRYLLERLDADEPFRVLSMERSGQDVRPGMFGLELAGGHHPNDLWRYRELIGMAGSDFPEHLYRLHPNVLPALNIRYILWPEVQLGRLEGIEPVSQVRLPDGRVMTSLYEIQTLPRARVVGEALVVDENETLEAVLDLDRFDPVRQTVLAEEPPLPLGGAGTLGGVRWIDRTPDRLVFEVETTANALVVLSENWFPAWHATVDGRETPVLRADHALRAVAVPEGTHRVEMWYRAPLVRAGLVISLVSLLLVAGAAIGDLLLGRRPASLPADARRSSGKDLPVEVG